MYHYDPLQDRSEQSGWSKVPDEAPPSDAEQAAWANYTVWFTVVFCVFTMFVFMDKPW